MNSQPSPLLLLEPFRDSYSEIYPISAHHHHHCRPSKIMILHLLISVFLAGVSLSLVQAHQNVSTILPHCAVNQLFLCGSSPGAFKFMADNFEQHCTLQAFNQSTCTATNHTYAAVFNKCEIKNCTAAEKNGDRIPFLRLVSFDSANFC